MGAGGRAVRGARRRPRPHPDRGDDDESEVATGDTTETTAAGTDAGTATTTAAGFAYGTTACPPTDGSGERTTTFADSFQQCIDPAKTYTAVVKTNKGEFTITLDPAKAPGTVNNFVSLARSKYYDGVICHRVVANFVVQCGDPDGTGSGGPGYEFADELPAAGEYKIGSIAMANAGANTNGSQFFIITGENGVALPPNYSLFGQVTDGLDTTVKALADLAGSGDGPPTEEIVMESVTITES